MTNLINDLLDLTKMDTLNFKFNNEFFDMNNLVKMAIKTVKYIADKKNINIK